jgi:hypothetical protein
MYSILVQYNLQLHNCAHVCSDQGEGDRGRQAPGGLNGASRTATGASAAPRYASQQQQLEEDDDKTLPSSEGAEEDDGEDGIGGAAESRPGPMFRSGIVKENTFVPAK